MPEHKKIPAFILWCLSAVSIGLVLSLIGATLVMTLSGCGNVAATETGEGDSGEPFRSQPLQVVGHLNLAAAPENITDVYAQTAPSGKTYAYLGSYDLPFCSPEITGVHIVDISQPDQPAKTGFLPAPAGTRVNDVKVAHVSTPSFEGDLLIHSTELCQGSSPAAAAGTPGIVLYDVTDPLAPRRLAPSLSLGIEVHNLFMYQREGRAFAAVVQDQSDRDFHLVEVTDPAAPVELAVRGWQDWLDPDRQLQLGTVPIQMLHDVSVASYPADHANAVYAGKTIAYLSYWDAGLILLDITDPANPIYLGDSDYVNPDPVSGRSPEGNSHTAVPTEDGSLVFMGDEDFATGTITFSVDSGPASGRYRATSAGFSQPVSELEEGLSGATVFVGAACSSDPAIPGAGDTGGTVAFLESGGCPVSEKLANAEAAGYAGAIIHASQNRFAEPETVLDCDPQRTIPALQVGDPAAFAILGMIIPEEPDGLPLPAVGTRGEDITARGTFDGWGYGRILDVSAPDDIRELSQVTTENVMRQPPPPGNYSLHNVALKGRRAYLSWYGDGIRVVDFSDARRPREIARFIDEQSCSDFWGVFLLEHPDGGTYILGSDRSTGLWIFEAP